MSQTVLIVPVDRSTQGQKIFLDFYDKIKHFVSFYHRNDFLTLSSPYQRKTKIEIAIKWVKVKILFLEQTIIGPTVEIITQPVYIVSNDIFLLCHKVASTTHVTDLFTGQ